MTLVDTAISFLTTKSFTPQETQELYQYVVGNWAKEYYNDDLLTAEATFGPLHYNEGFDAGYTNGAIVGRAVGAQDAAAMYADELEQERAKTAATLAQLHATEDDLAALAVECLRLASLNSELLVKLQKATQAPLGGCPDAPDWSGLGTPN